MKSNRRPEIFVTFTGRAKLHGQKHAKSREDKIYNSDPRRAIRFFFGPSLPAAKLSTYPPGFPAIFRMCRSGELVQRKSKHELFQRQLTGSSQLAG